MSKQDVCLLVSAWNGESLVAIAKSDIVETCRLSEEGEVKK